ncbi:MAG: hypothetical protein KF861_09795 [Planctomycetaceae bacterium]|nr:hypothetical protein [Planctomycetaceae bacterium]
MQTTTGNVAICDITNGVYKSKSGEGPNPGQNLVMVQGKESADGNPMWSKPWSKTIAVGEGDFTEDFSVKSTEVKPFDPKSVPIDD